MIFYTKIFCSHWTILYAFWKECLIRKSFKWQIEIILLNWFKSVTNLYRYDLSNRPMPIVQSATDFPSCHTNCMVEENHLSQGIFLDLFSSKYHWYVLICFYRLCIFNLSALYSFWCLPKLMWIKVWINKDQYLVIGPFQTGLVTVH